MKNLFDALYGDIRPLSDLMQNVTHTVPNVFGGLNLQDSSGLIVGFTDPNVFGGVNVHDAMGHVAGFTDPNVFGGVNVHDAFNLSADHFANLDFSQFDHSALHDVISGFNVHDIDFSAFDFNW